MTSIIESNNEVTQFHKDIATEIYEKFKKTISEGKITIESKNKLKIITVVMEYLETYRSLSGKDKKIITKQVVHVAFSDYLRTHIDDEELAETIETIIALTLGKISINKTFPRLKAKIKKFFQRICGSNRS